MKTSQRFFAGFVALCLLVFFAGCAARATATKIEYSASATGDTTIKLTSPKDTEVKGFDVYYDPATNRVRVKWDELKASASSVLDAQTKTIESLTSVVGPLLQQVARAASPIPLQQVQPVAPPEQ